jgi:outer membrane protein TolC
MAEKSLAQAKALGDNYLPELTVGMAYQKLDDPTSYGNNYSFNLALHIPLNSSDQKEAEALKAKALSQESHKIELQLQRENQYIALLQNYESANKQLQVLQSNLNDYIQSQQTVKDAFVKQYIDFNSYLQVLSQTLHIQEQIIDLQQQRNQNATFINSIASGVLYE